MSEVSSSNVKEVTKGLVSLVGAGLVTQTYLP